MKSVLFWMLRHLVIPAGIILATGIPQTIYESETAPKPKKVSQFTSDDFKTLEITRKNEKTYLENLVTERRVLYYQKKYTAFLYMRDLKQILMYQEKNPPPAPNRFNAGFTYAGQQKGLLYQFYNDLWLEGKIPYQQVDSARALYFPKGEEAYLQNKPNVSEHLKISDTRDWFIGWLTRFYLHGLPFAFMLFFLWKLRMKDDMEFTMRHEEYSKVRLGLSPFSFLVSLLVWPIILGIDIYNRTRDFLREAEIVSRRSIMLGLFSKQEKRLLELSKSMSLREFREHLNSLGMTRKHSFVAAVFIVLCMSFLPRLNYASTNHVSKQVLVTSIVAHEISRDVGHSIDWDDGPMGLMVVLPDIPDPYVTSSVFYYSRKHHEVLTGFFADIGGVPKVFNQLRKKLIVKLLNFKNEKYTYCSCSSITLFVHACTN